MAEVITAVGAGGKTTWLLAQARAGLALGKSVLLTTTTRIWAPRPLEAAEALPGGLSRFSQSLPEGTLDYAGILSPEGKLLAPSMEDLSRLRSQYDLLLIEGDGSRCCPMKIPAGHEPVVPPFTDKVLVVMGLSAIGRKIGAVCHRYAEAEEGMLFQITGSSKREGDLKVTLKMLERAAELCYLRPLREKYPGAELRLFLSDPFSSGNLQKVRRVTLVLLASGFSRRFGGNKLLADYRGKALYLYALESLLRARRDLSGALPEESSVEVLVVTQYQEIFEAVKGRGEEGLLALYNPEAMEGISASIRLGSRYALTRASDAVLFFAADMPDLPGEETGNFLKLFLASGKSCGCMETVPGHCLTNPGAFRLRGEIPGALLSLSGEKGGMKIIRERLWDTCIYQVPGEEALDIDTRF